MGAFRNDERVRYGAGGRLQALSVFAIIAVCSFLATFVYRSRAVAGERGTSRAALAASAPESLQYAALGVHPGRQLVAHVFGSSRCRSCRSEETKRVLADLRDNLRRAHGAAFDDIRVIGVAVNTDLVDGLDYLRSVGLDRFDQVAVGSGWENEDLVRLIRQFGTSTVAPQVVLTTRTMQARVNPFLMTFSSDSLVGVVLGNTALHQWVPAGLRLPVGGKATDSIAPD